MSVVCCAVTIPTEPNDCAAGDDYVVGPYYLVIIGGINQASSTIRIVTDTKFEYEEAFSVRLNLTASLQPYASFITLAPESATINIIDEDSEFSAMFGCVC